MIDTSRISSGFDVEFQLGGGWFFTAINGLAEKDFLFPIQIEVTFVQIIFNRPDQDLAIGIR